MQKYTTMLTPDYIPDWQVADGIREFCANALDSDSALEYDVGDDYIILTSVGVTLPPKVLTMGTSGNRLKDSAVGKHGEGILTGLIPILREGGKVEFQNGDKLWTPRFEYSEQFDRDTLVIEETQYAAGNNNFTVSITNIDSSVITEVVERCLYLQKDLGTVFEGKRGRVLMDTPNKLYVGGLFVCDIKGHLYSYDFSPAHLPLNRDRKSVDTWSLAANVTALLEEVLPAKDLAQLVSTRAADAGGWYSTFTSDEVAEEVYAIAKESYGNTVVIVGDGDEKEKLEKRGFKNVEVVYNDQERKLIQKAPSYQEFLEELEQVVDAEEPEDTRTPIEILKEFQEHWGFSSREQEDAFDKILELFDDKGVSFD